MKLAVAHRVGCEYDPPVEDARWDLRVLPSGDDGQRVVEWAVAADGAATTERADASGNRVLMARAAGPVARVCFEARGVIETRLGNPFAFAPDDARVPLRDEARLAPGRADLAPWLRSSGDPWDASREVELFARSVAGGDATPGFEAVQRLMRTVHAFEFRRGVTGVDTPPEDVLRRRAGLCQDFATLLCAAARALGLAARYVSGYVYDGPPETRAAPTATHAWAEVFFARIGWRGFDAANGLVACDTHARLAAGRWFRDVAPLSGGFARGGARQRPFDETDVRVVTEEAE